MKKMSRFVATLVALGVAGLVLAGPAVAASAKTAPAAKINLNSATADQLSAVPGVGKTLAERIVAHRQKEGPFRSVQELMNVKDIDTLNERLTANSESGYAWATRVTSRLPQPLAKQPHQQGAVPSTARDAACPQGLGRHGGDEMQIRMPAQAAVIPMV